jgi:hypothetical protein
MVPRSTAKSKQQKKQTQQRLVMTTTEPEVSKCKSLETLKTWVEGELRVIEQRFAAIKEADSLLREQNKVHFENLNNEGKRITAMTEKTVSQDTWAGFIKQNDDRDKSLSHLVSSSVSKEEFQMFKTSTERTLTLISGESKGRSDVWSMLVAIISVVISVGTLLTLILHGNH